MDPHKTGLNQPPPAHNMSGPSQHPPPPHNMAMGQPMPQRTMQPGYMLPRPAHTGSVPMPSKPNQTSAAGALETKPQHPGGSSSPKPVMLGSNPVQEKTPIAVPLKSQTPPGINALPTSIPGKQTAIPPLIPTLSTKPVHQMQAHQPYQHMGQMQHQQLRPAQHMQIMPNQPQINAQNQQMHVNPQQNVPQQQNQQMPAVSVQQQQQNQNVQAKVPQITNATSSPKPEAPKGPTPPVPDLISISKPPPSSQPLPPSTKANNVENKPQPVSTPKALPSQQVTTVSSSKSPPIQQVPPVSSPKAPPIHQTPSISTPKPLPTQSSNSSVTVAPVVKPAQNSNASPAPLTVPTQPASAVKTNNEVTKTPSANVSIIPAIKPLTAASKPDLVKTTEGANTVTITRSGKDTENDSIKIDGKSILEVAIQSTLGGEHSLNGVATSKPQTPKPAAVVSKPTEVTPEIKAPTVLPVPKPYAPTATQTAIQVKTGHQTLPFPKHSPTPPKQQTPVPKVPIGRPSPNQTSPNKIVPPLNAAASPKQQHAPVSVPKLSPQAALPPKPSTGASTSPAKASTVRVKPKQEVASPLKTVTDSKEEPVSPKKEVPTGRMQRNRKPVEKSPVKVSESNEVDDDAKETPAKRRAVRAKRKDSDTPAEGERKSKRSRNPASIYQSPVPEVLSRATKSLISTPKTPQEKLILFFKNEHVAVRNTEGTFFLCQIAANVYKSTRKLKIRWLTPLDDDITTCERYKHDYYDFVDFDCILTSVALQKGEKSVLKLPAEERNRILNILQRALDRDQGISPEKAELDEDHPDGLDISLYNDEAQLKKRKKKVGKRKSKKDESTDESDEDDDEDAAMDDGEDEEDEPDKEEDEVDEEDNEVEEEEEEEEEKEEPPPKVAKTAAGRRARGAPAREKAAPAPAPATEAPKRGTRTPGRKAPVPPKVETPPPDVPAKTPRAARSSAKTPVAKPAPAKPTPRRTRK